MIKNSLIVFTILFMLFGCTNNDPTWQSTKNDSLELTKLSVRGITDQQPADKAKEFLSHFEEIAGVRAVNQDGELIVAVDVKHHDRFSLEKIEEALRKDVRENFSDMNVTLSTDKKIFIELKRLETDILDERLENKDIKKRLKQIKKLSKEET